MGLLPASTARWSLTSLDRPGVEIIGDFTPTNVVENVSGKWEEQATLGLIQPALQFVGGNLETWEFDARVWAKHQGVLGTGLLADNIDEKVEAIRNLARPVEEFGRPEVFLFSLVSAYQVLGGLITLTAKEGEVISAQVVVRSVGGIRYDRFRGDGSIRGVMCAISLARYTPYDITNLTKEAESLITPTRPEETYEHIAQRVLGSPTLGEALRRRNPERPVLVPGDLVHVPSAEILRREITPLAPRSLFLKQAEDQRENLLAALEERGQPSPTHVLLTDWE